MFTIENGAGAITARAWATGTARITPVHDPVDRRHSDLAFNVDTAGRPFYRVLIARDPRLFAAAETGARNASNFYDSQREGLLPYDGPPAFYLVPSSVLQALLPAPRLYYTLIAYTDASGGQAAYAHPPETLPREAPFVAVANDLGVTLSLMFGTPVSRLVRVGGGSPSWEQALEETGEDLEVAGIGLAADDGAPPDVVDVEDDGSARAAAYDAGDDPAYGDGDGMAAAAALDEGLRPPLEEESEAAAALEDEADPGWRAPAAREPEPASQSLADDYDDGFGGPPRAAARSYEEQAEDEEIAAPAAGSYGAEAPDAPPRQPVPEMLPDEEADGAHAAVAGDQHDDDDEVEIAAAASAVDADGGEVYGEPYEAAPRPPFDIEACKAILARIQPFESGADGFARVGEDGEFAGRFGTEHPAYRHYHLGLTFGAFPFVQEHGTLGQLLGLMRERDRATFDQIFPGGDELVAVTTSAGPPRAWESPDGLSPRLRPVGGAPLWREPWVGRFRRAGQHPPFQGAQNELAARLWVQPVMNVAQQLGLDSDQALTLLVDRAVQMGVQAGLAWVLEAATPVETPALKQRALAALGHADLQAFQTAQRLPVTAVWDVATHAALIAALRAMPASPSPVLGRDEIVAAMVRHAQGTPWAERLRRLRDAAPADRLYRL